VSHYESLAQIAFQREKTSQAFRDATQGKYKSSRLTRMKKTTESIVLQKLFKATFECRNIVSLDPPQPFGWDHRFTQTNVYDNSSLSYQGAKMEDDLNNTMITTTSNSLNYDRIDRATYKPQDACVEIEAEPFQTAMFSVQEFQTTTSNDEGSENISLVPIDDQHLYCFGNKNVEFFGNVNVTESADKDAKTFNLLLAFTERYENENHMTRNFQSAFIL
jgi:hypothetical protein